MNMHRPELDESLILKPEDSQRVLTVYTSFYPQSGAPVADVLEAFRRAYNDYVYLMKFAPTQRCQLVAAQTQLSGDDDDRAIRF